VKGTYKTLGGKLTLEIDVSGTVELVRELARIQDICEQTECSHCKGTDFKYGYRVVNEDPYYELVCKKCHWKLGFTMTKKDPKNLYPRRINQKTKQPIGPKKDGWHLYENEKNDADEE
jgi:hypothetical protein